MAYCATNVVKAAKVFLVGLCVSLSALTPIHYVAAQSNVQVVVCRDTQPAALSVTSPKSDSVVGTPTLIVSGAVSQSHQLEVYVDGAFNSIESLPPDVSIYTTSIQLSPGTHTVKLVAVDACQIDNAAVELIVTYQPVSVPSNGNQVPTVIQGMTDVKEVAVAAGNPIDTFIIAPTLAVGKAIDLVPASAKNFKDSPANVIRFSALVTASALILLSGSFANGVLGVSTQLHIAELSTPLVQSRVRWLLRGVGVGIVGLVFIL
jgi:hypothetical protein